MPSTVQQALRQERGRQNDSKRARAAAAAAATRASSAPAPRKRVRVTRTEAEREDRLLRMLGADVDAVHHLLSGVQVCRARIFFSFFFRFFAWFFSLNFPAVAL